jgi:hypothetical protein
LCQVTRSAGCQACFACHAPLWVRFFSNMARLRFVSRLGSLRYFCAVAKIMAPDAFATLPPPVIFQTALILFPVFIKFADI